jgi:GNAT superfamily N-acetyltransferase
MSADGPYVIRLAEASDIAALPSVERRAARLFDDWLAETGLTREFLEDVSSTTELDEARQRGHLWVAVAPGGEPAGFAQVIILDGVAHLDEIDVVPEHGRQGVGSRLIDAVCNWARSAGYSKVTLSTFRDVPWNRPFYETRGFRIVERPLPPEHRHLVAAEHDRGLRTDLRVVMERDLGVGADRPTEVT